MPNKQFALVLGTTFFVVAIIGITSYQKRPIKTEGVEQDIQVRKSESQIEQENRQKVKDQLNSRNSEGIYYISKITGNTLTLTNGEKYNCGKAFWDMQIENVTGWVDEIGRASCRERVLMPV